jgi:DNA-binding NtrC family response regulator
MRGVVLVTDDEEQIRRMLLRMLARLGYEAEQASDGVEAVALFRQDPWRYRAVFLDISMPRMGGPETLAALDAVRPGVSVAIVSGADPDETRAKFPPGRFVEVLPKPFTMEDLRSLMERLVPAGT